ncbi:restriction endonuclease subunit S [Methanobacterium alkalithermotolerans]|uniref:Restriction endonuclease subunit S n=1 Tax=Methanobacterium alkalithermotolerans TaxID=2731220 RepID=A0A8T8K8Q4_9EURY|nr:restriction endonuclease subunit S [Methanobacterium alkalithermotolerans]QUH24212.1 restriction endonuclease subunit S [Methanobacterium alkalithermotolerans]
MSVPELRFPEFEGEWDEFKLKEISTEIKRTSENVNEDVLTISASVGFISQKERWNKVIAGNSLKKYVLLKKNEFSYNRGNSKLFPYGCIYRLKNHDSALVPNVYRSFSLNGQNPLFFEQYFIGGYIDRQLRRIISSSARMDGLLNISKSDFFDVKIKAPKIDEQAKIGFFLAKVDEKIEKLEKKLELWEAYKKGMMQKIFSQELRFKDENGEDYPDWEEKKLTETGKIVTGNTPSTKNKEYYHEGTYLWVTPTDISSSKYIKSTERKLSDAGIKKARIVSKNSVLITCIASIGKNCIITENGSFNQQINAITPKKEFSHEFMYYIIDKNSEKLKKFAGITATPILNKKSFENMKFEFPCLDEQIKISNSLSSLDNKLGYLNGEIQINYNFKKGLLQKMFC